MNIRSPHSGQIELLTQLEPHEARWTLGIMMAMDGSQEAQCEYLLQKAREFADLIQSSALSKNDAWHALVSVFMWIVEYPMAAVSLNSDQWDKVMAPITTSVLAKAGFAKGFPHAVLYAPIQFQGCGLVKPHLNNYIQQLHALLSQTNGRTLTGELMTHELENLRLEIGLPGALLEAPYKRLALAVTMLAETALEVYGSAPHRSS